MNLLHENSLGKTLDAINDALFFEKQIPQEEARRTARWIAGRQGLPTSYAGMFAPTNEDYKEGVRLFTGERISSRVGTGHILGEEACRALLLLNVGLGDVENALDQAMHCMELRLRESEAEDPRLGFY